MWVIVFPCVGGVYWQKPRVDVGFAQLLEAAYNERRYDSKR